MKKFFSWTFFGIFAVAVWCDCGRDTRLAGQKVRDPQVRTVTMYGQTLDQQASPEQVGFATLQAIRDDFKAKARVDRDAALDKEFDLAAANEIQARNRSSMSRNEYIHNVVYRWTPTASHYVDDFPSTFEQAKSRFVARKAAPAAGSKASECELGIELADANGDPNAHVVLLIWLAQDQGYWRVLHLGFDATRRTLAIASSAAPPHAVESGE